MRTNQRAAIAVAATLSVLTGMVVSLAGPASAATNLLTNPGFESGNLTGWTCDAGTGAVTTSPVHSGTYALAATPTSSLDAQCTQTVAVSPNTAYTLSGYVDGAYVYIGATGYTSNWITSTSYTQLSTTFTTGASTTSIQVYVHGWYSQGTYYADDLSLTGGTSSTGSPSPSTSSSSPSPSPSPSPSASASPSPSASSSPSASPSPTGSSGGTGTPPSGDGLVSTPTGVKVTASTSGSVTLAWNASTDTSGTGDAAAYYVYEGGSVAATSMGTSVTVSSLKPSTAYSFTVSGYDKDGHQSAASPPVSAATAAAPNPAPHVKSAYFDQWGIYGNAYYPSSMVASGAAAKLNTLDYAFENIDPTNLTCFEAVKAADTSESDPSAGDGAGDAYADYQKSYASGTTVDGGSDVWSQPIKGNFNQLRELKAKYPNIRIMLSIGGWTYSKYFSSAAATSASRQKFVSSCVNMFIKGNLPTGIGGDASGGPAAAAGLFDGIDIDWEYPASSAGHLGNIYSAADTQNFTYLLGEFRSELDTYGASIGKKFELTATLPSGQDKLALIQTNQIGQYLDDASLMAYDMHGAWDSTGPTNFQDPLYQSSSDPSAPVPPGTLKYSVQTAVTALTTGLPAYNIPGGFPAGKIVLGVPFYWRGWTGVPAGGDYGLYQSATGASASFQSSATPGLAFYKELASAGLTTSAYEHWDPTADAAWIYNPGTSSFYTGDTPQSISTKAGYITSKGLGGMFAYSLEGDDSAGTLVNALGSDLS